MADVDAVFIGLSYYEADPNTCPEPAAAPGNTVLATTLPAPLEDADKIDIYFDVSAATGPDYSITAAGDWLTVGFEEACRQSLLREYITNPGEWATKPEYGAGGRAFLKAKATKANRDAFAQRLRARTLANPRVDKCGDIAIERFADGGTKFDVQVFPKTRIRRSNPITVTFDSRQQQG